MLAVRHRSMALHSSWPPSAHDPDMAGQAIFCFELGSSGSRWACRWGAETRRDGKRLALASTLTSTASACSCCWRCLDRHGRPATIRPTALVPTDGMGIRARDHAIASAWWTSAPAKRPATMPRPAALRAGRHFSVVDLSAVDSGIAQDAIAMNPDRSICRSYVEAASVSLSLDHYGGEAYRVGCLLAS